jgi:hypothetical protein
MADSNVGAVILSKYGVEIDTTAGTEKDRIMRRLSIIGLWSLTILSTPAQEPPKSIKTTVLIYGATPAGIAAAVSIPTSNRTVYLAEPTERIGGMITNGLSHTDFRTFENITGSYRRFTKMVEQIYAEQYGPISPQARGHFRGTHAEPKVNLLAFEAMLGNRPRFTLAKSMPLKSVSVDGRKIKSVTMADGTIIEALYYIDATYEGDLMAAAKVDFKIGREGKATHGEALAPDTADDQLQGYNYRLIMTNDASNRVAVKKPDGYKRDDFQALLPLIAAGKIKAAFGREGEPVVFKAQHPPLPNGKFDMNDVSKGLVRLSLPGENLKWATATGDERAAIAKVHRDWMLGLMVFMQTDAAVPESFRKSALEWGLCKDEIFEGDYLPPMLYVRESRRMQGEYVFTQADTRHAEKDARAILRKDAIAIGDYGHNCHGTAHEGPRIGGKHTGEFYEATPPYQIPYGVLLPKSLDNLAVPVACSSSHVGFCALRLEPIWMNMGQAAGTAVYLAQIKSNTELKSIPASEIQTRLWSAGSATIAVNDVPPDHVDFNAVQWWGMQGGLHGLHPTPAKPGPRGKNIIGQYYEAFPGHAVDLDTPLTPELRERWGKLVAQPIENAHTRGDFIRAANQKRTAPQP